MDIYGRVLRDRSQNGALGLDFRLEKRHRPTFHASLDMPPIAPP